MKNNKIYMALAHLYEQFKGVVGNTGNTLSQEINSRIENNKEVVDARKGHATLIEKIDSIDASIDSTNETITSVANKVVESEENIRDINTEINSIKNTNPTVELDNGNHLLVDLKDRITHNSVRFSLSGGASYRISANAEHYVNQLYVKDNIVNEEVDMSYDIANSSYDETRNYLDNGHLYSVNIGLERLQLQNLILIDEPKANKCAIHNLCTIEAVGGTYTNSTNHVINAFKQNRTWYVKANEAEVLFNLKEDIFINNISFSFTANTSQQSVALFVKKDGLYSEIKRVPSTDGKIVVDDVIREFKLVFYSLSNLSTTVMEISNVNIIARAYIQDSGLVYTTRLIDMYDLSGQAQLGYASVANKLSYIRYAITNTREVDKAYVYYSKSRVLPGHEFVTYNNEPLCGPIAAINNEGRKLNNDGSITQIKGLNEFVGKISFSGSRQKVNRLSAQFGSMRKNARFFVSANGYAFYTYVETTNSWIQNGQGMSARMLESIPYHAFEKIIIGGKLYIKVVLDDIDTVVNGIDIEFNRDRLEEINTNDIMEYGMLPEDLEHIPSNVLLEMIDKTSRFTVVSKAQSKLPCFRYVLPALCLAEYGGISWSMAQNDTAKVFISGNTLIVTNITTEYLEFRLEQKYFEDRFVQIGDPVQNEYMAELIDESEQLREDVRRAEEKVHILDQNVLLLKDAIQNGTTPPDDLPTFIIPEKVEVDLEPLAGGASTRIPDIDRIRYVQYWDTQLTPVPESIRNNTISKYKGLFLQENGYFDADGFRLDRTYDIDNSYLMNKTITSNNQYQFVTNDYTCTTKCSDGGDFAPLSNQKVGIILSYPNNRDSWNYWSYSDWRSSVGNLVYSLPGEERRWMDIDINFNTKRYIYSLANMDFGGIPSAGHDGYSDSYSNLSHQITTIFLDYDGSGNWVEFQQYKGYAVDKTLLVQKEVKKIRIRLEVPYSNSRGAGTVAFKYVDIYYCPIRYVHDIDAQIRPALYYSTETWNELLSVLSDATIFGKTTDIRYFLEVYNIDTLNPKFLTYDGNSLIENDLEYSKGMTLSAFNNLSSDTLSKVLDNDYVRPVAILHSDDGIHTPVLESFNMVYSQRYTETTRLVNPQDVVTDYDAKNKSVIVTNATTETKTLKAIIS